MCLQIKIIKEIVSHRLKSIKTLRHWNKGFITPILPIVEYYYRSLNTPVWDLQITDNSFTIIQIRILVVY